MKNKLLIIASIVFLSSCQKIVEATKKDFQTSNRKYIIEQFSGGKLIRTYNFTGTLNDSEYSDGYYFFKGDTLIEISGDVIIKSITEQ